MWMQAWAWTGALAAAHVALGQGAPDDWAAAEAPVLTGHVPLTSREHFVRAGEAYFSPDGEWIIFQAVPVPPPGQEPGVLYAMYVAKLARDAEGSITGTEEPILLSPSGSANTCGWFHPRQVAWVLFASTIHPPEAREGPGYGSGRYRWMFPREMDLVTRHVAAMHPDPDVVADLEAFEPDFREPVPIFRKPGYTAEASWSPSGRYLMYAQMDEASSAASGRTDVDIWIVDASTGEHRRIVDSPGYDGGPFFSPDETRICFRADRDEPDVLQIHVAGLDFDDKGAPTGLAWEKRLTGGAAVNWCPFWHPDGTFLVYASSELGHFNYEVMAIEVGPDGAPGRTARVTHGPGADVLPAFSADGRWMMWTAQRGPTAPGEERPSSQLWVARFDRDALFPGP